MSRGIASPQPTAALRSGAGGMQQQWRSLFLPIAPSERVVFCSFYTSNLQAASAMMIPPTTAGRQWSPTTILAVLADATIVIYSLESDTTGPAVVLRITPQVRPLGGNGSPNTLPSNKSMTSDAESMASRPGSPSAGNTGGRIGSAKTATCASLIPQHLCGYLSMEFFHHHPMLSRTSQQQQDTTTLRGIVGFAGGRVEVFCSAGYIFGFQAHACDVSSCSVVHAGDFSGSSSPAPQRSNNNNSSTGGAASGGEGSAASLMTINNGGSGSRKYLDDVCHTAFVTMGVDGHIFVWRRRNAQDGYEAASLRQPGIFTKCHAISIIQPTFDVCGALLSNWSSSTAAPAAATSPAASATPPQPAVGGGVGQQQALPFTASLVVCGGNGYDNELFISGVDTLNLVEPIVEVPGTLSRTSAIATEGSMVLIAREKIVFAVTYSPRVVNRLITTNTTVLQLELSKPLAVAGCRSGKIIVFGAETGTVLGTYSTFSATPVCGLSFHYSAMLLSVVDGTGAVEVVELPADFLRHGSVPSDSVMPSANVLKRMIQLEESSSGDGALATARRAVGEESLLLAKLTTPQSLRIYLGAQHMLL